MATTVPGKPFEILLQPRDAFGVEVVGRFIEEQHLRLLEQQAAQRDSAALSTRQRVNRGIARGQPERVHRDVELVVQVPDAEVIDLVLEPALFFQKPVHLVIAHRFGEAGRDGVEIVEQLAQLPHAFFDVASHVFGRVELRLLREVSDASACQRLRLADEVRIYSRHDPQQRALACTVGTQDADLGAGIEGEVDAFEDLAGGRHDLSQVAHGEDVFAGHRAD